MKITVENKVYEVANKIKLEDFAKQINVEAYIAKVNNRLRELTYEVTSDCVVEFLTLSNIESTKAYQATLKYVVAMAIDKLFPEATLEINYGISRSFYCELKNLNDKLDHKILTKIDNEIENIIKKDLKIKRLTLNKNQTIEKYKEHGYLDKIEAIKYRPEDTVHLYQCEDYINYMYSYMLPSTGYLKEYKLRLYYPGFILQYPRSETNGIIPEFADAKVFSNVLQDANIWGELANSKTIPDVNKKIENNEEVEFINLCETKHSMQLSELGNLIKAKSGNIRLVAVAGPSSSGKTTFTNRLKMELLVRGIKPVMISIDDYYLGMNKAPKNEDGSPDLEHIEALDIDLFNRDMLSLINGEEVTLPHFNFELGQRQEGAKIKVDNDSIILIEGIHALNDQLTSLIPNHQKFKVFIAPQLQMRLDNHNPLSITDIRLIRRMVRDYKYRNSSAENTLSMWTSVRNGEFKWIYDNQESANYVFNSELTYELCVLKKYAMPLLEAIKSDSIYYIQANRLIKFLKYFLSIDDEWVPCNSLLREFIGGSSFSKK